MIEGLEGLRVKQPVYRDEQPMCTYIRTVSRDSSLHHKPYTLNTEPKLPSTANHITAQIDLVIIN